MIRRLMQKDIRQLMDYLAKRPAYSVYIASNVKKYGFEGEKLSAWADFGADGIQYGFIRFYDSLQLFSEGDIIDAEGFARYLDDNGITFKSFIARSPLYRAAAPYFKFTRVQNEYLSELAAEDFTPVENGIRTEKATENDLPGITALRESIEEFHGMLAGAEVIRRYIQEGNVRIAKYNGRIVSAANCSATAFGYAGIGGVCTDKDYRGRGFASRVVSDLSAGLVHKGLRCCLTYDNPEAGSIYKRIGYRETGYVDAALNGA